MSPLRQLVVSVILAGILAAQTYMSVPPDRASGGWYWPFVSYPMYRQARHVGDELNFTRLDGVPCEGGEPTVLTYEDLGIQWHSLHLTMLDLLEEPEPGSSEPGAWLRRMVAEKHAGAICTARVSTRTVRLGSIPRSGIAEVPWFLRAELEIP